jgi:hypothetical protein
VWDQARGLKEPVTEEQPWAEEEAAEFYKRVPGEAGRIAKRSVGSAFEKVGRKPGENSKPLSERSEGGYR